MDPTRADALLASFLFLGGLVELVLSHDRQVPAVVIPANLLTAVLLSYRRRAPVRVVFAIAVVAALAEPLGRYLDNTAGGLAPYLIAAYTVGVHYEDRRRTVAIGAAVSAILCTTVVTEMSSTAPGDLLFIPLMAVAAPIFAGRLVGGQLRLSRALREKNLQLELEREERARAAVADERARVARELHDVVAHSVSVMVVQSGAARSVLNVDPARAAKAFEAVETVGRDALVEMRRLLGMLRPEDEPALRAPQPGLARLDALVDRACAAGLDVSLNVAGERPELPPGVDLAAYRVVQEALTNAIKHASGARVVVAVEYEPYAVAATVVDDGGRTGAVPLVGGSGHGIAGMRERVELYGGELTAGPTGMRGFAVSVRFPLRQEAIA
jgi:signal transduction histidine kinase